jgi:formamidopyrimidine-DNA glycosylase
MHRVLSGKTIAEARIEPDEIVLGGRDPKEVEASLIGRRIDNVGRKGKFWWLELDEKPWLFGHLGMSGWIRHLGADGVRLHSHGEAPLDDERGTPRFLKLMITAEDGQRIAFTDGRRLGRLWLAEGPDADQQVKKLGRDVHDDLPNANELADMLKKRKPVIKAVLLDQALFAGVGNWVADEVLYQSGIAPSRQASSLSLVEVERLREALRTVVSHAVDVDADHTRYPDSWLFLSRWGGNRGAGQIDGHAITRETIGGRTTAWVPTRQK